MMTEHEFPLYPVNLPLEYQGKSRDTFGGVGDGHLLMVATDRISTHNIVHASKVPKKGEVLTALTIFWVTEIIEKLGIGHHVLAYARRIFDCLPGSRSGYPDDIHHRSIVVEKLQIRPVEFIFRNRMGGSYFKSIYSKDAPDPYGLHLPQGIRLAQAMNPPLFTPTEKSDTDPPLKAQEVIERYPYEHVVSLVVNMAIRDYLQSRGIDLFDTKIEMGVDRLGRAKIADEIVTPDSSRFCRKSDLRLGEDPPWLDKQVARDEAEKIWAGGKKCPIEFSPEVVRRLTDTYLAVFEMITGMSLVEFQRTVLDC